MSRIATVVLLDIKEPDVFGDLQDELSLNERVRRRFFLGGEYGSLELQVDDKLNIVGGRFLKRGERY